MTTKPKLNPTTSRCRRCGTTKNLSIDHSNASGVRSLCRKCSADDSRRYRQEKRKQAGATQTRSNSPTIQPINEVQLVEQMRRLLTTRNRKPWTVDELSDAFNVGVSRIKQTLEQLDAAHINLQRSKETGGFWVSPDIAVRDPLVIPTASLRGKPYRFALTADNHLCSKYARMDVLNALYDLWAERGIDTVYQCGNMIDGEARFNKGDLVAFGIEGQTDYFVENWPQRKGMTTYFVTGDDHEGWYVQREHVDIGQLMEDKARRAGRTDLVYLGHMEHDLVFQAKNGKATGRIIHAGGGSAYATSYSVQKIVESYQGGQKPQFLGVGHYHKFDVSHPREVYTVQCGATQDQTPFLRKNKIQSMLGGCEISFEQSDDGVLHGFTTRWDPFFDRAFYADKQWKYQWRGAA